MKNTALSTKDESLYRSNVQMKTPIEIVLGIDENGMTTTKKLYEFLGMDKSNYSRWIKRNITENEFAEEGVDFYSSNVTNEGKGNFSEDYKLTSRFAKKLSMLQKNERGEQAREYFTSMENYAVEATVRLRELKENPIELLELHYEAIRHVDNKVDALASDLEQFKQELPLFGIDEDRIVTAVRKKGTECLGGKDSNAYNDKSIHGKVFKDIYRELKRQFGISGTYKQLRRNQCDMAVKIVEDYAPPLFLHEQICDCNAQVNMSM